MNEIQIHHWPGLDLRKEMKTPRYLAVNQKEKEKKKLIHEYESKEKNQIKYLPVRDKRRTLVDVVAVVADGNDCLRTV